MAGKASTPLKSAMGGDIDKLSDKQTKSALSEAVGKLGRVTKLAETSREQVIDTGTALMHSAETMGSLFMGSMAEGFFGPEKLRLGGVDMRAPTGLLMQGYGLYQILSGESGGEHFLSIGNGVTGSWLASVGQDAGRALRERRSGGAPAPAQVQPAPASQTTTFRGEEPMVHVPALEGQYGPVYGGAAAHFNGPGLLPPPSVPAGFLPAPGWQSGHAPQYAHAQHAPQMSGPVREILPAEDVSGYEPAMHGYNPAPVAGHYNGPVAGYPNAPVAGYGGPGMHGYQGGPGMHGYQGGPVAGSPGGPSTGFQPHHVMQLTPEGVEGRPRMRFTPAVPAGQAGGDAGSGAVEGSPRQARGGNDAAQRDDVAGPRQRMQQRRQARRQNMANRFPRARRAEEEEGGEE